MEYNNSLNSTSLISMGEEATEETRCDDWSTCCIFLMNKISIRILERTFSYYIIRLSNLMSRE